ncbi:hypothetical protein BHF71_07275 [Vulcanibacillus modesticaldus]|uniref:DUF2157 domain-containing protein n=1 Tax=Vulcanibacillus modesticaldus TaxID=337097 RepID=A0A1D2YW92_9BACI|nr:DUF2157 domain-containing protein [Vulcanibacillus modesticaldus]OEF99905.1 hypothetical protein BHF71_07275 [Vulcanibacillus modesticaldus]
MDKYLINRQKHRFIEAELTKHYQAGRITEKQLNDMLDTYQVKEGLNFIKVLVTVGAILIGLGILSLIASNWQLIIKPIRLLLIVFGYITASIIGFDIQAKYPKTGRSLIYLSFLIFGAGIFLIGQMFNFGGRFTTAFLLWAIGIFPLTTLIRDRLALSFVQILLLVYLNGQYVYDDYPIFLIILIPLLYYVQKFFTGSFNLFLTNTIVLNLIWYTLDEGLNLNNDLIVLTFFMIGLLMFYMPNFKKYQEIFRFQGNLLFGLMGLLLTIKSSWDFINLNNYPINIIFTIIFIVFLLSLVKKENLLALLFVGLIILRFYFDTFYNFLPKSLFFLTGGILLLGFGFYFERKRKLTRGEGN